MPQMPAYRLQALFEIRQRAKKDAEESYAKEQKKVAAEEKKRDEMKQKLSEMVEHRENKRAEYAEAIRHEMLNISKIQMNNLHIDMLLEKEVLFQGEISKQEQAVEKAKELAKVELEKMLKATQEFKALEKHKEKWQQGAKKDLAQKEEDAVEDISQAQYFNRLQDSNNEDT